MPKSHQLIYFMSRKGLRGTKYLWKITTNFRPVPQGWVKIPSGFILEVDESDFTTAAIYRGWYDNASLEVLEKLQLTATFVDIGANIGVMSYHASRFTRTKIITFEPILENLRRLKTAFFLMGIEARVSATAVANTEGTALLYGVSNHNHRGSSSLVLKDLDKHGSLKVEIDKLDNLLSEYKSEEFFLKIDCEGAEDLVVEGAKDLLSSQKVQGLIIEVNPGVSNPSYLYRIFDTMPDGEAYFIRLTSGFFRKTCLKKATFIDICSVKTQENVLFLSKSALEKFDLVQKKGLFNSHLLTKRSKVRVCK
jgi:FkbM family methyltransferase